MHRCRKKLNAGTNLHIGARSRFWAPDQITIGDHVYIGSDVHIEANCEIGSYCLLANRVAVVGRHDHDFTVIGFPVRYSPWIGARGFVGPFLLEKAVIEEDVWLGYGVIVLTGVRVGRGAIVAAGSVVVKNIEPYSISAGVPAKKIGQRFGTIEEISMHEAAIASGRFGWSERGYDFSTIEPNIKSGPIKNA